MERALEAVPDFEAPAADREQYRTPSTVAADLVWAAWTDGDIDGRTVLDLGCGTGILAKAASLLGAKDVLGVDVDATALAVAADHVPGAHFTCADVQEWTPVEADTVLMNPPFGAQKGNRNADRAFYDAALRTGAKAIWFLAPVVSERFLTAYARDHGIEVEKVLEWEYPLPATMAHHRDAVRSIRVGGYRMSRS